MDLVCIMSRLWLLYMKQTVDGYKRYAVSRASNERLHRLLRFVGMAGIVSSFVVESLVS